MSQSLAAPSASFGAPHAPSGAPEPRVEVITVAQVKRALARRWRWLAVPTLVGFLGSALFVNVVSPRYTAEAKLLLESGDSFYTRPGQDRGSESSQQFDEQAVASQVQVVLSRDLAREAIRRLGLVGNPEFDPMVAGPGLLSRLMILSGASRNPLERPPEERVLDGYLDRLLVFSHGRSRIVTVEFRSKDPDLAARAANTVAELYLQAQETAKKDTARSASTWLGANIQTLRARVAEAEGKVEAFRAGTGLLIGSNNATIASEQLSEINTQLSQARSGQAEAQAKARLIRDMLKSGRTFDIPDVANNELIRRLIEQRVTLRAQLALESRTLLPAHPRIKELNAQLSDLEAQIRGAAERTVRTLENDARLAGARMESLQAAVDAQKKVSAQANENEVQLRALEREAKAQRDQLETYLARYREATARDADNAAPPDARIVSRAVVPISPSFPKKGPTILIVTLACLVLAAALVIARELLGEAPPEPRAFAAAAPEPTAGLEEAPVASPAPASWSSVAMGGRAEPAPARGAFMEPMAMPPLEGGRAREEAALAAPAQEPVPAVAGPAPDARRIAPPDERYDFEALVARLARATPFERGRRVLVTGLGNPIDALDTAQGLGRTLSWRHRAILVSVDSGLSGVAQRPGFTDLVAGEASFADIIEREPGSRLHRVPPGTLEGALLSTEWSGVDIALQAFDQTYDWVVCLLHDDRDRELLGLLAPRVDAVVIASSESADHPALVDLYEEARDAGAVDVVVARERAEAREAEMA